MDCRDVQEVLSAYHDRELARDVADRVAEHLAQCERCSLELSGFQRLSTLAVGLDVPAPPHGLWNEVERQLAVTAKDGSLATTTRKLWQWICSPQQFALAAAVILLVGIGLGVWHWRGHGHERVFAADFAHYLNTFQKSPAQAQEFLLSKYDGRSMTVEDAVQQVGYTPAASRLPDAYTLNAVYAWKMPCCRCVQCVWKRDDGTVVVIFEHNEAQPQWFDRQPSIRARCHDCTCQLAQLDGQLAASWKSSRRHVTIVGARDVEEVGRLVAWFNRASES